MKARILELVALVAESARADKDAGRLVWAEQQLELCQLIRQMFVTQKKKRGEAWKRWYQTPKGKAAQQRKKEKAALGPHKYDHQGGGLE